MRRRDLITLLGGATIAWPSIAMAQQPAGVRKIGVLATAANDRALQARLAAFRQGLAARGWTEGQNVQFDTRYAGGDLQRFEIVATELVKSAPDAILAVSNGAVTPLKQRTRSIPIVFVGVIDPVGGGYVSSLSQPGGNITGFSMYDVDFLTKMLQLLREIAPRTTRAGLAYFSTASWAGRAIRSIEAAVKSARIDAIELPLRSVNDFQRIARLGDEPDTSLIVFPSPFALVHRAEIVKLAARYRLPAIYGLPDFTPTGGLMSYNSNLTESFRQAASYVDRILRGAKPGDLPVQNPTKYTLSINLKTAKALGLTVPQSLLIQADEVIK